MILGLITYLLRLVFSFIFLLGDYFLGKVFWPYLYHRCMIDLTGKKLCFNTASKLYIPEMHIISIFGQLNSKLDIWIWRAFIFLRRIFYLESDAPCQTKLDINIWFVCLVQSVWHPLLTQPQKVIFQLRNNLILNSVPKSNILNAE